MAKFINTNGTLDVIESTDFETIEYTFPNEWLDLTPKKCLNNIEDMFNPISSSKPVVYTINFIGNEEELDWVIDDIIRLGIDAIVPEEEQKWKELRPQPRDAICDRLSVCTIPQVLKRLINYKSITEKFTIRITINNEIVYDLIREEK